MEIIWLAIIGFFVAALAWVAWLPTWDRIPRFVNSVGALRIIPFDLQGMLQFLQEGKQKCGRLFHARLLIYDSIILTDPEDVNTVFVKNKDSALNRWQLSSRRNILIRKGLLAARDDEWYHSRKLIAPLFNWAIMEEMTPVFDEKTKHLIANIKTQRPKEVLEFRSEMSKITADVISQVAFGQNFGLVDGSPHSVSQLIDKMIAMNWTIFVPYGAHIPTQHNKEVLAACADIKKIVHEFIQKRKEEKKSSKDEISTKSRDFLQVLFDDNGANAMSDDDLFDECVTMFVAGHETTSTTAAWAIYEIGKNPEIEKKLQLEIDTLGRPLPEHLPLPELKKLEYLGAVIDETLRLHPVATAINRELSAPIALGDNITLDKGTRAVCNIMGIHRDASYWPNPDTFDPARFLPENSGKINMKAYLPFGTGPRICVGQRMALAELRVILARIYSEFSIKLNSGEIVSPGNMFLHRPDAVHGTLIPREN